MLLVDWIYHSAMALIMLFVFMRQSFYQILELDLHAYLRKSYQKNIFTYYSKPKVLSLLFMGASYLYYVLYGNVISFLLTMIALIMILTCFGIEKKQIAIRWHPLISLITKIHFLIYIFFQVFTVILYPKALFIYGFILLALLPGLMILMSYLYYKVYLKETEKKIKSLTQPPRRLLIQSGPTSIVTQSLIYQAVEKHMKVTKNRSEAYHLYDFLEGLPKEKSDLEVIIYPTFVSDDLLKPDAIMTENSLKYASKIITYGLKDDKAYRSTMVHRAFSESIIEVYHQNDLIYHIKAPLFEDFHLNSLSAAFAYLKCSQLAFDTNHFQVPQGFGRCYPYENHVIYDRSLLKSLDLTLSFLSHLKHYLKPTVYLTEGYDPSLSNFKDYVDLLKILKFEVHVLKTLDHHQFIQALDTHHIRYTIHQDYEVALESFTQREIEHLIIIDHIQKS